LLSLLPAASTHCGEANSSCRSFVVVDTGHTGLSVHSCCSCSSFPVILGSRSLFRSYLMAPTIAAWQSLLQVALAVGHRGSGTPVLSAVVVGVYTGETGLSVCWFVLFLLLSVASRLWHSCALPLLVDGAGDNRTSFSSRAGGGDGSQSCACHSCGGLQGRKSLLLAPLALVVVEAVVSCRSSVVTWKMLR
jgi:hypothetical protein